MKYDLSINQHNIKPHLDIERDIQQKKNGLFTFNLRINQGNIEDYAKYETITAKHYTGVVFTIKEEYSVTFNTGVGGKKDAVRTDDSKRNGK